ncbi:MAG: KH domain-containing protein [Candidatus Daviesbacteria bacterium]|nr:KH domain-containing protein [Candidatus Daviesbacteria bacterium]
MKDLVLFIAQSLVTKPDAVVVLEVEQDGALNLNLTVDPEDMGIIIGKSGQTIRAIRKLLFARAMVESDKKRVFLNLIETGSPKTLDSEVPSEPLPEANK